jgi:hypothetical protein
LAFLFLFCATSQQLTAQFSQQMLCVYIPRDELGTLTHHFRQNGFAIPPNKCHVREFNYASTFVAQVVKRSPGRPQLSRPLINQAALQQPSLFIRRIGDIDFQHVFPNFAVFRLYGSADQQNFVRQRSYKALHHRSHNRALNPNSASPTRIGVAGEKPNAATAASEFYLVGETALSKRGCRHEAFASDRNETEACHWRQKSNIATANRNSLAPGCDVA